MRRHLRIFIWLGGIGIFLGACGTTREAREEDKVRDDFKMALAERQLDRRRQTADRCLRGGVTLPEQYRQKGGGMLEDYVPDRPPCGIPAQERIAHAEADFRAAWQVMVGEKVPLDYEWLLSVKRRIGAWIDAEGIAPAEARRIWREARWLLVGREGAPVLASIQPGPSPDAEAQFFGKLNHALNGVLDAQGITCRRGDERRPCF